MVSASERPLEGEEQAYREPIEHLIRCSLFLLRFKSPSTKESLSENEQIVPVGMMRSLSEGNSRSCDANKVNLFREWLENWKHWKGFKKEGHVHLQFPVEEIVKYINSWHDLARIRHAIAQRALKCEHRTLFYSHYTRLLRLLGHSPRVIKYVLGSETLSLHQSAASNLEAVSASKIRQLTDIYAEFKDCIKDAEGCLVSQLPRSLEALGQGLKGGSGQWLERVRLLLHTLFLLESENPQIDLDMLLYVLCFKYLSNQNEDLVYIANALLQRGFVGQHTNEQIVVCLSREVGHSSVASQRWKDYFFTERVLFLLRKLEVNLRSKDKVEAEMQVRIAEALFYILYHVEIPLVAQLGLKLLKRLNISLKHGLRTPFDYEYKLYRSNAQKELQLTSQFRLPRNNRNNVTLLCSKIHQLFDSSHSSQLATMFQAGEEGKAGEAVPEDKAVPEGEDRYNIVLNLHQEEDLYWMLKVLYYADELEVRSGEKTMPEIKDFEEYLGLKSRKKEVERKEVEKKEAEKKESQNNPEGEKEKNPFKEQERNERIFNNLPKFTKVDP